MSVKSKIKNIAFTVMTAVVLSSTAESASTIQQVMLRHLDAMAALVEQNYAPQQWKKEFAAWDLYVELEKAKTKVHFNQDMTLTAYHNILRDFFNSMQDYHVGIVFVQNKFSFLPFTVRQVDGRYFIVWIDRERFSLESFPFSVGDEIVRFNGKAIQEEIDFILAELGPNSSETQKTLAAYLLTTRVSSSGHYTPKGPVTMEIRKKGERSSSHSFQTFWTHIDLKMNFDVILDDTTHALENSSFLNNESKNLRDFFLKNTLMVSRHYFEEKHAAALEKSDSPYVFGSKNSFLPAIGEVLWSSSDTDLFQAYIFQQGSYRIAYIRIPRYYFTEDIKEYEQHFKSFHERIKFFEKDTDALVIDQHHNPGGSILYLYALASVLSDRALKIPLHHISINPNMVLGAKITLEELKGIKNDEEARAVIGGDTIFAFPINMQFIRVYIGYLEFILDQWEQGKILTDPAHLLGLDRISPRPGGQYTKPILLLVDEVSFSGGDFFPAILQDNKRATIMGTRTAGAGGYVQQIQFPNIFGVHGVSLTGSHAKRVNDMPIENLGVTPNILYTMTVEDYQNEYTPYREAIVEALKNILEKE